MELVVGFTWLFGSLYALVSLFRPLPPFRSRKQAILGLGGFQVLLFVGAGVLMAFSPQAAPQKAPPVTPSPPQQTAQIADEGAGHDISVVRIKPGEKHGPPAVPASDIAAFRAKARAGMKTLDAAELVLEQAVQKNRADLVREARNAAQEVSAGMIADRQPFAYTTTFDDSIPCAQAANALSAFARSLVSDGEGVAAVQERTRLLDRYQSGRNECARWLEQD